MDYGTSNATVFGLFGTPAFPVNGLKAWLEREYYHSGRDTGRQKTDSDYADDLQAWLEGIMPDRVIVDPSAASFKAELSKRGFTVVNANNDVLNGIRTHARMLKNGEFKILKSCPHAIRSYSAYLWDARAQARGEDKPLKQDDHCFVAGTMVTTRRGQIPIEEVTVQDEALTRAGYRRVLKAGLTQRTRW